MSCAPDNKNKSIETYSGGYGYTSEVRRFYREAAGKLSDFLMFQRMAFLDSRLLMLRYETRVIAYGWCQTWRPLLKEFWWLNNDGICLGPFWVHPEERGRGLYGELLKKSILEASRIWPKKQIYIWAEASNHSSIRGIEKIGFNSLGKHSVQLYFNGLFRIHKVL